VTPDPHTRSRIELVLETRGRGAAAGPRTTTESAVRSTREDTTWLPGATTTSSPVDAPETAFAKPHGAVAAHGSGPPAPGAAWRTAAPAAGAVTAEAQSRAATVVTSRDGERITRGPWRAGSG
jgi:hypothetical protein